MTESAEGQAGSWPELLPRLQERARITREDLTRRLAEALGFSREPEIARVHAYYHQMEHGRLDAGGVSDRVLDALAAIVGSSGEQLRAAGERFGGAEASAATSFARMAFPNEDFDQEVGEALGAVAPAGPGPEFDELDELFLGRHHR